MEKGPPFKIIHTEILRILEYVMRSHAEPGKICRNEKGFMEQ